MVRPANGVALFLLTFNYQSGSKWAARHVMIARRASPRNCALFSYFIYLDR